MFSILICKFMEQLQQLFKYRTDNDELISIKISYHKNIKGINYLLRLGTGGFNREDNETCGLLTKSKHIRPRYIMYNYGSPDKPVVLKTIFKRLDEYLLFIAVNKDNIKRYVGEDANPNMINVVKD